MSNEIVPAHLRFVILERAAAGWTPARIVEWLKKKYGTEVTVRGVLRMLDQASAERTDPAREVVREHLRAELPRALAELADLRARAKRFESEAREAGDWTAARGFMAEQRGAIGLVLRYSGAGEPDAPSEQVTARVHAELEAVLETLEEGLNDQQLVSAVRPAPVYRTGRSRRRRAERQDLHRRRLSQGSWAVRRGPGRSP